MYTVYNLMYPRPRMISYIYFFLAVKLNLAEFRFSGGKLYLSTMISSLTVIGKVSIVIVKRNHKDGQVNAERYLMSAPVNKLSGKNFFKKVALTLLFMPGHLFIRPRNNLHLTLSVTRKSGCPNFLDISHVLHNLHLKYFVQFDNQSLLSAFCCLILKASVRSFAYACTLFQILSHHCHPTLFDLFIVGSQYISISQYICHLPQFFR